MLYNYTSFNYFKSMWRIDFVGPRSYAGYWVKINHYKKKTTYW